ncbi:T3SS effector HopA1 family protein [Spirosoma sp. KNUC1025]|uniref:T3SS effector HopA1 family protein n=1 Tax=Spirosoma sp. KNUC1025 TaxID=2894082 RepID=UPI003864B0AF|nr:T3SS effector HopA1 family protein [Spirosoma sp. KNUC1025]
MNERNASPQTVLPAHSSTLSLFRSFTHSFAMSLYEHQLNTILNGLRIDPTQKLITLTGDETRSDYKPETLHTTLAGLIYRHFYSVSGSSGPATASETSDAFVNELSRHNQSAERFDSGWKIESVDMAGVPYAAKGNYRRMLYMGEFVYDTAKRGAAQTGDTVRVHMHRENRDAQSGFYYVFGQTPGEDSIVLQTRLYFHITPEGSNQLIDWLTKTLNTYRIPFQFKCLNHPDLYSRSDAAVLYLQKPSVNIVLDLLTDALPTLSPYLRPATPLFTRTITSGVGFAESPPNPNESFGTSRCGLIAQGIANAVSREQSAETYEQSVRDVFDQIGLSLEHPYRNPQSHYPYVFPDYSVN